MESDDNAGFVRFVGDAEEYYASLSNPAGVAGLWEQILYIAENPAVDYEIVFEFPTEDDLLKIVYGPPFTIAFKNLINGELVIYSIINPGSA